MPLVAGQDWADFLDKSLLFYYAQRSGDLPDAANSRVPWRSDAFLSDGVLQGGYFDAGDYIKFNFPMAWSMTTLAWGAIEYKAGYKQAGQWNYILDTIKYGTDYLMVCMDEAPNGQFYCQVGDGADHSYWGPPPLNAGDNGYPSSRSAMAVSQGADIAGEMAAAFAAASMAFREDDSAYAAKLLDHAKEIYAVAEASPTLYTCGASFYKSFGYQDELVWGALWLARATGEATYLNKAKTAFGTINGGTAPSWDEKKPGSYVLAAIVDPSWSDAQTKAKQWADSIRSASKTPGGMVLFPGVSDWGALRHAQNTAFVMFVYADRVATGADQQTNADWAVGQLNYAFGSNPSSRTYMVGVDATSPKKPHHRSSHGGTSINNPADSLHVLYGALVGGPGSNDDWEDRRDDFIKNEVALDYNAGISGSLARMVNNADSPQEPVATPPPTTAEPPMTTDPPTAPPPVSSCTSYVYEDGLNSGYSDWSWGSPRPNFSSTTNRRGSRAIEFSPKGNGQSGLQLACSCDCDCINLSGASALSLWVHGGSGGQEMRVELKRKGVNTAVGMATFTATNSWKKVEINLSSLGNPSSIATIQFLADGGNDLSTVWIDEVGFINDCTPLNRDQNSSAFMYSFTLLVALACFFLHM